MMTDPLHELEHVASYAAYTLASSDTKITNTDVERWMRLFGLSAPQAREQIREHRNVSGARQSTDRQWELVKAEKTKEGYDREAWEFSLQHPTLVGTHPADSSSFLHNEGEMGMHVLKLEGPLSSVERVQHIAGLSQTPDTITRKDETGDALFCKINEHTRQAIIEWLERFHSDFKPSLVEFENLNEELE